MRRIYRVEKNLYKLVLPPCVVAQGEQAKLALADSMFSQGCAAERSGGEEEALGFYDSALQGDSDHPGALNNAGVIHQQRGHLEAAESYYRRAIVADPGYVLAHYNLGNILEDLGSLDQAIDHYNKAVAVRPEYADAHYNLAGVYRRKGLQGKALLHYRYFLRYTSPDDDPVFRKGAERAVAEILRTLQLVTPLAG